MTAEDLEIQKVEHIIQKIISDEYKIVPGLPEIAFMTGMSVSRFKIIFNNKFGDSPLRHILDRKLILARELLRTGRYSVSQVCYKVGFNHPSGFTRLFKHKFNCTPSEIIFNNWS